jgi:gliding motility-associated-like protein
MRGLLIIFTLFFTAFKVVSQNVWLHPNKGQWDKEIEYMVELSKGHLYIDKKGFTYNLFEGLSHQHDESEGKHSEEEIIKKHVIQSHFNGSTWSGDRVEESPSSFYRNYFLGNEQSFWRPEVYSVGKTTLLNYYSGIDMVLDGSSQKLKYSFIVEPGIDPSVITYDVKGGDRIYLQEGSLHIVTRFGEIIEEKPIAWTEKEGRRVNVPVEFRLEGEHVSFHFPQGYNENEILVIDPYLVFSTFTGSAADNWGFTAAPDPAGNLFAGGIVFSPGYPVTTGAIDVTYNTGTETGYNIDLGITKFNDVGTALLYSTYLGGTGNETPNSIISSPTGDLFILGVTSSPNFPMGGTPYDNSFNGGPSVTGNNLGFTGSDIYIARLNPTGTAVLASTYVGGSGTDGLNLTNLHYNYGDQFRGEIVLDASGNVYVASTTQSADFPVVLGSQGSLSGSQDAVLFKMPPSLNSISWSTFYGGSNNETGNSVQIASNGDVYMAGGTTSTNLPLLTGNDLSFNGITDGYVSRFNGLTGGMLSGTYMGYGEYDQAYFVQLDIDDYVYVFGQSQSAWPITAGCYGTPNSGQFIQKYSSNLMTINWTTMVGGGSGNVEISPTAFLVSDCYDIYFSGWGGLINQYAQATLSTSNGFQCTPDAFQLTTNGNNFYIAVLDQDATALKYGTYMGGFNSSSNHVDGGTSRFDKSGRIYHAVCGACGGNDFGFTSTPGVWSPNNQSSNCNLAAFKFELNTIEAIVSEPQTIICLPDPVIFNNNSANGNSFFWNFGDGTTSTDVNPSHVYAGPGNYTVTLVVSDSNGCFSPDSVEFDVQIGDFQGGIVTPNGAICPGEPFQLEAFGGANYAWSPAAVLDDSTSATPIAVVYTTTTFTVVVSDSCGVDTLQIVLPVFINNPTVSNDTSICIGNSAQLVASGGGTYSWTPILSLDDPLSATPIATPDSTTLYNVEIISINGCISNDSVLVSVFYTPPIPIMPEILQMCVGTSVGINVSGGDTYLWSPNYQISSLTSPSVTVSPANDFTYYCDFFNACGFVRDSIFIDVVEATIFAGNDTTICPGESAYLWASGGISYSWFPSSTLSNAATSQVIASPLITTLYTVIGVDLTGCTDTASVLVELYPQPFIQTSPDVFAIYGDAIQLTATSTTSGPYIWSPAEYLSCVSCTSPVAMPNQNMTYTVTYTDANGCSASDVVNIYYNPILYIPNTFTPNGDEHNQGFRISASNIKSFELMIFNRWGELIFTMDDFADYWDGTYEGLPCQDGTYIWKIKYFDFLDKEYDQTGHINLLR